MSMGAGSAAGWGASAALVRIAPGMTAAGAAAAGPGCRVGLRGRGAALAVLFARPDRPRRCTLPITALRVMPPSSAAI
ncbi:hypothetical protein CHELA17_63342 [Chelatococcus asaccharovorans]|nr:hypothetical protein CHELA17_63342 [Chelatococcus asaccharovorans]